MKDLFKHIGENKKTLLIKEDSESKVFRLTAEDYNFVHYLRLPQEGDKIFKELKELKDSSASDYLFNLFYLAGVDAEYLKEGKRYSSLNTEASATVYLEDLQDCFLFSLVEDKEYLGNLALVEDRPKKEVKNAFNILYFFECITNDEQVKAFEAYLKELPELEALQIRWEFIAWAVSKEGWKKESDGYSIRKETPEGEPLLTIQLGFTHLNGTSTQDMPIFRKAWDHWAETENPDSMLFAIQQFINFESIMQGKAVVH